MHVLEFLTELQNAEIFPVTLLRSDSTTDAFSVISKILGHSQKKFAVVSVFIKVVCEWVGQLELLKRN